MLSITKPKNKKTLVIISLIILSLLVGGGVYMFAIKPSSKKTNTTSDRPVKDRSVNDINYSPSTDNEKKDSDQAKQNIVQQQQNPPASSPITITISRASQTAAGQPLSIRTIVGGATSGDCNATLTDGSGHTVTQSGTIVANVSAYICNLDIPINNFPAAGAWNLSIVAKSGTATSPAVTQQVTITR